MKMKKIAMILIALLMVFATVTGAMATEQSVEGNVIDIPSTDYTVGDLEAPSFWAKLFGQPFTFVSTTADDSRSSGDFTVVSTHGAYGVITDGKYSSGSTASAGAQCVSGDYIRLFEYAKNSDGKFAFKRDLFDNIYKKTSSSDNLAFIDGARWTKDFSGYYGYACLHKTSTVVDIEHYEYYCRNGEIVSVDDKAGNFQCESNTCEKAQHTATQVISKDAITRVMCGDAPVSNDPAVEILEARVKYAPYEVGDKVTIVGVAKINKDVSAGVIESSLTYDDYVSIQPLNAITESSTNEGACGDDITTGVTFSAKKGDTVTFTLRMTAKEEGKFVTTVLGAEGCGASAPTTTKKVSFTIENEDDGSAITGDVTGNDDGTCEDGTYDCFFDADDDVDADSDVIDPTNNDDITDLDTFNPDANGGNDVVKTDNVSTVQKWFDFENNPTTAYGLVAMIFLILALFGWLLLGNKK